MGPRFLIIILLFSKCTCTDKPFFNYQDIINSDSISVKLTKGETINESDNYKVVLITLKLFNKSQKGYYLNAFGITDYLNCTNGENIYLRFKGLERQIFIDYLDTLPRAVKVVDSVTLQKLNNEVEDSISKMPKEIGRKFLNLNKNIGVRLCFIKPKTKYVANIPVLLYSKKRPIKVYFLYHDYFTAARNDKENIIGTEYYNRYIHLPDDLAGYLKLKGTLISDTLEIGY